MRDFTDKIELSPSGHRRLYPWRLMTRPGDAFVAVGGNPRACSATASQLRAQDGRKFAVRTVSNGVRVTLIETPQ